MKLNSNFREKWNPVSKKQSYDLEDIGAVAAWAVVDSLFCVLTIWSGVAILQGGFKEAGLDRWIYIPVVFYAIALNIFNAYVKGRRFERYKGIVNLAFLLVAGLAIFQMIVKDYNLKAGGFIQIAYDYIQAYNTYYRDSFAIPRGNSSQVVSSLSTFVMALMLLLQTIAAQIDRRRILFAWPALALAAVLFVGYIPGTMGLLLFAAGLVVVNMPGVAMKTNFKAVFAASLYLLLAVLMSRTLLAPAAKKAADNVDEAYVYQQKLEKQIMASVNNARAFFAGLGKEDGRIQNAFPIYSDKELLNVTVDFVPQNNVYFREYVGETYRNGQWKQEINVNKYADSYGFEDFDIPPVEQIAQQMTHSYASGFYPKETGARQLNQYYDISIRDYKEDNMLLPYGVDYDSIQVPHKTKSDELTYWTNDKRKSYRMYGLYHVNPNYVVKADFVESAKTSTYQENYDAYSELVRKLYLDVPEDQASAIELGKLVGSHYSTEAVFDLAQGNLNDAQMVNRIRVLKANEIHDEFMKHYIYSKRLNTGTSEDPVEYFLSTSKKGFCVHFASAGVMALRAAGVPARYAAGYVLKPSQFSMDEEGTFTATLKDSDGHAWVEIYMENIGWMPYEMTIGYGGDSDGPGETIDNYEPETESETEPIDELESELENMQSEIESELVSEAESESETLATEQIDGTEASGESDGEGSKGSGVKGILTGIALTMLLLMACGACFAIYILTGRRREEEIERASAKGRFKRAAKLRNQQIYRELQRRTKRRAPVVTDAEYKKILERFYPGFDWNTFITNMCKAVYGRDELTSDEYAVIKRGWEWICHTKHVK